MNPASLANLHWVGRKVKKANAIAYANVIECLFEGPSTYADLSEASGLGESTLREIVQNLRAKSTTCGDKVGPLLRIHAWERDRRGRMTVMVFAWNPHAHRDHAKPILTPSQRALRYRRKKEAIHHVISTRHQPQEEGHHHGQV